MTQSADFTLLVLDIGTSSTRALLFDAEARLLTVAQAPNTPDISPAGDVTFDANTVFAAVVTAIDQVLETPAAAGRTVDAVAACTFVTNVFGLDAHDRPLTPIFTYAAPGCAPAAAALRTRLGVEGARTAHDRTGCLLHASYLPARFHWLAQHHPAWLAGAQRWLAIGDYVLWRLTGALGVSYSVAAWTGLLDRRRLCWDEEWLARLALAAERLPPLVEATPLAADLQPAWRDRWPALSAARWLPAIGDGAAANVGSGAVSGERVALTIGTTGAMRVIVPAALTTVPEGLWLYRLTAAEGLLGGATTEGGNLVAWLRATLRLPPLAELEQAVATAAPTAHGLTVLPFIAGERAPGWHDAAQAALIGFTQATTPVDIYRAALEAIAYRFALIYQRLAPQLPDGGRDSVIVASGGALTGSAAWQQIMADVVGRPLLVTQETELSARGVALVALRALGEIASPAELPPMTAAIIAPNTERHARYQAALMQQTALYRRLLD